jgi:fibronectin-binding autotransporter adhesin
MANKKISELTTRTPSLSDLMLVGDPSSGYSFKCTVTALATIIETDIADGYVTLGTAQTISGAKTFSNNLTLTSVSNAGVDTDKFLVLSGSNVVNFRTGAEVLSDIGAQAALTNPITGTGTSGQVSYFNGTNSITSSPTFAFTPTSQLLVNNSVTAASAIARGINATPSLTAAANNDVLVGLDINPTFTNGAFTGVTNYALRVGPNTNAGISSSNASRFGFTYDAITFGANGFNIATNATGAIQRNSNVGRMIIQTANVASAQPAYLFAIDGFQQDRGIIFDITNGYVSIINGGNSNSTTYTPRLNVFNNGNVAINSTTDAGFRLDVNGTARVQGSTTITGSTTASAAIARGINATPTLVAAANNDVLVGLDINPNFTNGAFTGVANYGLRVNARSLFTPTLVTGAEAAFNLTTAVNNSVAVTIYGFYNINTLSAANASSSLITNANIINASTTIGSIIANQSVPNVSAGTTSTVQGYTVNGATTGTGTVSRYIGYNYVDVFKSGSGAVTRQNGINIGYLAAGATANIGILLNDLSNTSANGNWGIYDQSGYNNYIAGKLFINTTTDAGFRLDVNGTARVQGATTISGSVNSTATNQYFNTWQGTQNVSGIAAFGTTVHTYFNPTISSSSTNLRPVALSVVPTFSGTIDTKVAVFASTSGSAAVTLGANAAFLASSSETNAVGLLSSVSGTNSSGVMISSTPTIGLNITSNPTIAIRINSVSTTGAFTPFETIQLLSGTPTASRYIVRNTTASNSTVISTFDFINSSTSSTGGALGNNAGIQLRLGISNPTFQERYTSIAAIAPNQTSLPDVVDLRFQVSNASGTTTNALYLSSQGHTLTTFDNTTGLTISGSSLTGSNAQSLVSLSQTWNTTGNPTAIKLDVTNTASGANSYLLDLQVGGIPQFTVFKGGEIKTSSPAGGVAQTWKLGSVQAVTPTSPNRTIEVEVNGTTYYLHAKTTND